MAMEDEGFVDDEFIEETARDYVALHGFNSTRLLRERAAIAEAAGDYVVAQIWHEIVEAAERLVGRGRSTE
jgi:hypothetical protein